MMDVNSLKQGRTYMLRNGIERLARLGKGSFGTVDQVKVNCNDMICALKTVEYPKSEVERSYVAEEMIHRSLVHPNIVRLLDWCASDQQGKAHLLMEVCFGGTLDQLLSGYRKSQRYLAEDRIWQYLAQLLSGIEYYHNPNQREPLGTGVVVHRDLKPSNILLTGNHVALKIADFGISIDLGDHNAGTALQAISHAGTPAYMAPEILRGEAYDEKVDIWSVGCIAYEMCTGLPLFPQSASTEEIRSGIRGVVESLSFPSHVSQELVEVIRAMFRFDRQRRPSAKQILALPKFQVALQDIAKLELDVREGEIRRREIVIKDQKVFLEAQRTQLAQENEGLLERARQREAREKALIEERLQDDRRSKELAENAQALEIERQRLQHGQQQLKAHRSSLSKERVKFEESRWRALRQGNSKTSTPPPQSSSSDNQSTIRAPPPQRRSKSESKITTPKATAAPSFCRQLSDIPEDCTRLGVFFANTEQADLEDIFDTCRRILSSGNKKYDVYFMLA